ncbi:MAG: hypothetical protein ABL897_02340, partial [Hyphomicrobium sp.]
GIAACATDAHDGDAGTQQVVGFGNGQVDHMWLRRQDIPRWMGAKGDSTNRVFLPDSGKSLRC